MPLKVGHGPSAVILSEQTSVQISGPDSVYWTGFPQGVRARAPTPTKVVSSGYRCNQGDLKSSAASSRSTTPQKSYGFGATTSPRFSGYDSIYHEHESRFRVQRGAIPSRDNSPRRHAARSESRSRRDSPTPRQHAASERLPTSGPQRLIATTSPMRVRPSSTPRGGPRSDSPSSMPGYMEAGRPSYRAASPSYRAASPSSRAASPSYHTPQREQARDTVWSREEDKKSYTKGYADGFAGRFMAVHPEVRVSKEELGRNCDELAVVLESFITGDETRLQERSAAVANMQNGHYAKGYTNGFMGQLCMAPHVFQEVSKVDWTPVLEELSLVFTDMLQNSQSLEMIDGCRSYAPGEEQGWHGGHSMDRGTYNAHHARDRYTETHARNGACRTVRPRYHMAWTGPYQ